MSDYYCHACALVHNIYTPGVPDALNLTGSAYQLDKFIKHTTPVTYAGIVSIFDAPEYDQYKQYTVTTSASGSVEVDSYGRRNVIWYAGKDVGITYKDGRFLAKADTVRVVLHDDKIRIHTYPVDGFKYESKKCRVCGQDILC